MFHSLQITAQVRLLLSEGVVPLCAFLGLQSIFRTNRGLHGHHQAFISQLLQKLWNLCANLILTLVQVVNQQVSQHVGCGAHSTVSNGISGQLADQRSEEHTSELQSRPHLVCRLLLEKKKKKT